MRYDPGDAFLRGWDAALAALADRDRELPPSGFREARDGVIRECWQEISRIPTQMLTLRFLILAQQ